MFHIFSRKRFLADALEGFVDIHNHILPGIDDGAKTVEDSIAMIREFETIGVTRFIATPHIMAEYYPNTPESIGNSLSTLRNELIALQMDHITLDAAAEHMIDEDFEEVWKQGKILPYRSKKLLVEMSYLQPSLNFEDVVEDITSAGYFPVLAHPERYRYLHGKKEKLRIYKKKNVLFQLNLLSLSEFYGKDIQRVAMKLLESDMIDFAGSDIHSIRQLKMLKEVTISDAVYDKLISVVQHTISEFY